ncbi:MAG: hypothetical protein NZ561_07330 [Phycisphaerae bacterium]|nr:hypothetical protein [Phycisphaerae bacterium]MDW8262319.1 hypothetical protein [Phycisphaerales bacterium]
MERQNRHFRPAGGRLSGWLRVVFGTALLLAPAVRADTPEVELARRIVQASGGDVWPSVTRLRFTFNVEMDGQLKTSARHDWNVKTGVDTITQGDKSISTNVYEQKERQGDEKAAFQRWTNDTYWLLMPLKLLDAGVRLGPLITTRDLPPSRGRMTISFENVGLTPGDQYDLSIDLKENRIDHWIYRPNPQTSRGFTWEKYQNFNGLILSTEHRSDDGRVRIYFTDIEVERERE